MLVSKDRKCLHVTELFQSLLYTLNLAWKEAIEQNIRTAPGQISTDSAHLFLFKSRQQKCQNLDWEVIFHQL